MLVVDVSASGNFGSTTQSKRELAAEVACLLAFSAIRNNDKVGLLLFTDRVELFIPPKKGRSHTLRLIREILFFEPQARGTEPALALDYLNNIVTRRAVVFFISDFQAPDFDPLEMQMSILCHGIGFLPMEHGLRSQCHFGLSIFAAEEFHDIAPPVDYSLISPWLVFLIAFVVLSLLGLAVWFFARRRKPPLPPKLPREIALEELERISRQIKRMSPYQFSIRASDILRSYVTQQYGLLATRQTSIEFLTALAKASPFSADEKSLLEDFLNRCDLIKFARYEATSADSRLLLDEAIRFVGGGQLATVCLVAGKQ